MKYIALLLCLALAPALAAQSVELIELQHPAGGPVLPGTSDHEMMVFRLYKNAGSPASNLTQVKVAFIGTAISADWVAVHLYWDADRSRTVSTGDVSLATAGVLSGGKATFMGMSHPIQNDFVNGYDYLVVVDVASGATVDNTFEFKTTAAPDISVSAGTVSAPLGDVQSNIHTIRVNNGCEIDVRIGGTSIPSGQSHNVGYIPTAGGNLTFDIFNTGSGALSLTGTPLVELNAAFNCTVTVTAQPTSPVAPGNSTPFTVNVDPGTASAFTFSLKVENSDFNEFPYNVSCSGSATPVPEIDIEYLSTSVPDGWQINLGSYTAGIAANLNVDIFNYGSGALNLTGTPIVDFPGEANVNCTLLTPPTTPVAVSGMTTFTIQFTPAGSGSWAFEVQIQSNDPDETPYNFQFYGTSPPVTPVKLGVYRDPANAEATVIFGVQPIVSVQDANGAVNTSDNSTVVVASLAGGGAPGATLTGTLTATCVNGYATFTSLKINLEGLGYTLNFTHQAGTLTATTSAPFNVGPKPPNPPDDDDGGGGGGGGGGCSTGAGQSTWLVLMATVLCVFAGVRLAKRRA
jgi:hypothetical protein